MEPLTGIEPVTFSLPLNRSTLFSIKTLISLGNIVVSAKNRMFEVDLFTAEGSEVCKIK
jgi:hypothetical protein